MAWVAMSVKVFVSGAVAGLLGHFLVHCGGVVDQRLWDGRGGEFAVGLDGL